MEYQWRNAYYLSLLGGDYMNDPMPKGGYEAVLRLIMEIGNQGPLDLKDLVPPLKKFGYEIEDGESKALSSGGHTYKEITKVLKFIEDNNGELSLTEEPESQYNAPCNGQHVYEILTSDKSSSTKRGEIGALILLRLCEHDVKTKNVNIPNAFRQFYEKIWRRDDKSGRYRTNWNLEEVYSEMSGDWNKEKLRHCRQRSCDLGIARRGKSEGSKNLLYPILSKDILEAVVFYILKFYRERSSEKTPNFTEFYGKVSNWYPLPEKFYEENVLLHAGILERNSKISEERNSVLWELLNEYKGGEKANFTVNWLQGEDSWSENLPFAEFEIEGW